MILMEVYGNHTVSDIINTLKKVDKVSIRYQNIKEKYDNTFDTDQIPEDLLSRKAVTCYLRDTDGVRQLGIITL